jgi:hypothetical protein
MRIHDSAWQIVAPVSGFREKTYFSNRLRKLAIIAILGILLFNAAGYRLLVEWLQHRADHAVQARIDNRSYDPASLVELSVDLSLPYTTNWTGWEAVEGDIVINGVHYRYVERRLADGRMYVRCLPHAEMQQLLSARDAFASLAFQFNKDSGAKKSAPVYISNYLGDYDDNCTLWTLPDPAAASSSPAIRSPHMCGHPFIEGSWIPPETLL